MLFLYLKRPYHYPHRFENDELRSDREVNWKSRKEDLVALPRVGLGYKPVPDATPDLVAQYWEKFLPKGFDAEKILVQRAGITSIW